MSLLSLWMRNSVLWSEIGKRVLSLVISERTQWPSQAKGGHSLSMAAVGERGTVNEGLLYTRRTEMLQHCHIQHGKKREESLAWDFFLPSVFYSLKVTHFTGRGKINAMQLDNDRIVLVIVFQLKQRMKNRPEETKRKTLASHVSYLDSKVLHASQMLFSNARSWDMKGVHFLHHTIWTQYKSFDVSDINRKKNPWKRKGHN